jgi:arginyl-tRNA synthetase
MRANRNISRIDRDTVGGGFLVRVMRKGKRVSKVFYDDDFGGKRNSLVAAQKHRDRLEQKMRGYTAKQLSQKQRSNNTSGIVGVRKVFETDYRWDSEPTYGFWVAQWSPKKGVRRTKRFSIDKYGEDEAFRLAVLARKRGVASMGQ